MKWEMAYEAVERDDQSVIMFTIERGFKEDASQALKAGSAVPIILLLHSSWKSDVGTPSVLGRRFCLPGRPALAMVLAYCFLLFYAGARGPQRIAKLATTHSMRHWVAKFHG
jgi:hypothetical protein